MSRFENIVDQENIHARLGNGKGQAVPHHRSGRPVLGEISQNITSRRQPLRAAKLPEKNGTGFTIFCDENAGVPASKVVSTKIISSSHHDKENITVIPAPVLGSVKMVDSFSDSSDSMETDSPMVLDTSIQSQPQQWRVPPLEQHKPETVDIFSAPEYAEDIYAYLRQSEQKAMPKPTYMSKQPDISHSMRSILVDWLVEVGEEYKLQTETLYLAVSYIDRFLSYMSVQRSKLQLVGTAAMFIASKYEEIYPPDVGEFVYITDDTYNKRQVLRMEHLVLKVLGFDLSAPTANVFLAQMCQMSKSDDKIHHLAMYLCELSLLHGDTFLRFAPSVVSAASLALARHACGAADTWPECLVTLTGYTCDTLRDCLVSLHVVWREAADSQQQAIRDKYKTSKYSHVSDMSVPSLH